MRGRSRYSAASAQDELAVLMKSRERVTRQIHFRSSETCLPTGSQLAAVHPCPVSRVAARRGPKHSMSRVWLVRGDKRSPLPSAVSAPLMRLEHSGDRSPWDDGVDSLQQRIPIQLQQIILNLLRNAAEAMAEVDDRQRN
jgi:signal transduction histidine kinase